MARASSNDKTDKKPKVTVLTITYNQEKYVREFLDGFVAQKTDFDFEVIVADDHSTDKTPKIIEDYAKAHPQIFKPVLRPKNLGSWQNFLDILKSAQRQYLTICEGDDYWTDPNKLQLQVDFMDKHPDYAVCFHPVKVIYQDKTAKDSIYPQETDPSKFTVQELLKHNYIQTNSVMYRRQKDYKAMPDEMTPGDWYLHLYHAQFGKIGFINRVMSVYRRHPGGIWWQSHDNEDKFWQKYGKQHINFFNELLKLYGGNRPYLTMVNDHIHNLFNVLVDQDLKNGSELMKPVVEEYSDLALEFLYYQRQKPKELEFANLKLQNKVDGLTNELKRKEDELQNIYNSKGWQLLDKFYSSKSKLTKSKKP